MPLPHWRRKGMPSPNSTISETGSHDSTTAGLSSVIGFLDATKDLVPLDVAKGVLSTLSSILTIVKNTLQNKDDFSELISRCHKIARSIKRATYGRSEGDIDPNFAEALDELKSFVSRIEDTVKKKEQHKLRYRFMTASVDRESIANWKEQLDSFLQIWDHELIMRIDMKIHSSEGMPKAGTDMESGERDHEPPPGPPPMFFGRDDLVRDAVESLSHQHVVLVGPGGIGKSTIAKAILNEDSIIAKFHDRRFFVRFDNIDASQITFDTFIRRIADVLGVKSARLSAIKTHLAASD
ncbi:hypothetical protein BV22DRAFT_1134366, partial [Leucogyrophana mollusca]